MVSARFALDEAKARVEEYARKLRGLEEQQTRAAVELEQVQARIKEMGLDPDKPLYPQIESTERDIKELVDGIRGRLVAIDELLNPS